MAKTTKKKFSYQENQDGSVMIGWENLEACVESVYYGPHRNLLEGNLVFALRPSPTLKTNLKQLIIVKNIPIDDLDEKGKKTYTVGIITSGWTGYIPFVKWSYLEELNLEEWTLPKEIIDIYKTTIEQFKV